MVQPGGPVRVAVVGYGLGGSVFHAPLVSVTPRLTLAAIVTSDGGRQAAARRRYPDTAIVPSVGELLREVRCDLAVVTVPNARHVEIAETALRAGLSVVVDKPVAPTAEAAERLGRLAATAGLQVIPYHNRRWDGDFRTAKALVEAGRLGQLWRFESRFERWRPNPARTSSWKLDPGQAGSGVLYDLGTHLIDQALVLCGRPTAVYAELGRRTGPVVDDAFVALTFPGGLAAHLWAGTCAAQVGPRLRLLGSAGGYVKFGLDPQEQALRAEHLPTEPGWGDEPPQAWGRLGSDEAFEPVPTLSGAYQNFYAGVASCLLDGADPPVALRDAIDGLRVIEAAQKAADVRTVVQLAPGWP